MVVYWDGSCEGEAPVVSGPRAFMKLPIEERRGGLEAQAKALQKHYEQLTKLEEHGGGDFFKPGLPRG